jgi:DinB superfamily
MASQREHRQLLFLIDSAYDHPSWHGTNLRGSIRGLRLTEAAWRPARSRHNIWELLVHAAYWKYVAWRRLTGSARGSFALKGSNWFPRPHAMTRRAWQSDVVLLEEMHRVLRDAVQRVSPADLTRTRGGRTSALALVTGAAAHDLYHAGQIQLLKRLCRTRAAA